MRRDVFWTARKTRGFSLIELMIAIAIVAILAAIAYPSYQDSVRKTRRADGKAALTEAAALQEKWYFQNNQYTDDVTRLNGASSPEGYYTLKMEKGTCGNTSACFLLAATATGIQASDTDCYKLTLDNTGAKHSYNDKGDKTTDCW